MANTYGTARAPAAAGLAVPSTLQGPSFSTLLTRIAAIIPACGFEPDTAKTAPQSGAALFKNRD
jgi:hypothetical protein